MLKVEVKGVDKLIKKLNSFGDKARQGVADETQLAASDIAADAKILAPKDTGKLAQSINSQKIGNYTYRISTNLIYAPYMEFGTGRAVDLTYLTQAGVPKSYALQFKGKGIKEVNLPPQPFLFPALITNRQNYIDRLEKMLKKYGKDATR